MVDGIPNRPLYFHQKDIIGFNLPLGEGYGKFAGNPDIAMVKN